MYIKNYATLNLYFKIFYFKLCETLFVHHLIYDLMLKGKIDQTNWFVHFCMVLIHEIKSILV